ncbi:potassium channel family protein [Rhodoferax sp.]|uniref:potassium channel family protein n=1 Tax=Rhodoferax sp. TaxID=50421 RepID=UPI00283F78EF|nr:potassium channel family protein [Rhodoferax sp.]MDR3368816.1 potassium channel family protein [Rhodoferax sp.]
MLRRVSRNAHFPALAFGTVLLVLILAIGTVGYMVIGQDHVTWIDSFYMTFITVATIGYGEIVDLSHHPYGRLFTVLIAVLGIGTMSFLFSTFVAMLLDSKLNAGLRRRRMEKQIAKLSGHYIVCGIGRVGTNVTFELLKTKRQVVIIESNREALDRWLEHHPETPYLHDDATSDEALNAAGLMKAVGVFAVTPEDSQNLMVSLSVKLLNPKARVVARLHDISNAKKAKRAGADEVISPDFTGGMRIASAMVRPHVVTFMDEMLRTDEGLRVEEVTIPSHFEATPLIELVPKSRDYILMATHEHGKWVFNPADDHVVKAGTTLVLMANPGGRAHLEHRLNEG